MKEYKLPEIVQKRLKIAKLFYPLERKEERMWAKIFNGNVEGLKLKLEPFAIDLGFEQKSLHNNHILWIDPKSKNAESLFCLIQEITSFQNLKNVMNDIELLNPVFTYAIVHQKKDGEGTFDIFRFSKFSYLEHCNRLKFTVTKK